MKEKAVKWVKNKWLIAFAIIVVLVLIAGKPLAVFIGWLSGIDVDNDISAGDLLRSSILLLGVLGGAYGLYLSAKRQEKFSKQVDVQTAQMQVQADQSFNDRLGRGVELLADEKNVVMRCAGLQVLEDLVDNADDRQRAIVLDIIYNFFRDNAKVNMEDGAEPRFRTRKKTTQDLQDALDILINLSLNDCEKLLPKRLVAARLNFGNLDFSYLDFSGKTLESVNFSKAIMDEANFSYATIKNVVFWSTTIKNVDFGYAKIENSEFGTNDEIYMPLVGFPKSIISDCDFSNTGFSKTSFCNMHIENADFINVYIKDIKFFGVKFLKGIFLGGDRIDISSDYDLPHFVCTEINDVDFNFVNNVDASRFFYLCYHLDSKKVGIRSGGKDISIDDSRKYKTSPWSGVFIKSDKKDWSRQPVQEWIAVECAQWKLEQAEIIMRGGGGPADTISAQNELKNAIKALNDAQRILGLPEKIPQPKATDAT